ncbi:MAG: hypothetical protein PVSMB4_03220 [Ktedonobacterales bacterium]
MQAIIASIALSILVLAGTLVAASLRPDASDVGPRSALIVPTHPATATATLPPTPTPTPRPVVVQTTVPHTPPPPAVPTPVPVTPTVTFCPTPTPVPTATATASPSPTATSAASPTPTGSVVPVAPAAAAGATNVMALLVHTAPAACQPCPYYAGNNPSQSAIRAALYAAADTYTLPHNLLLAVAWQESHWHQDVLSCDGGIGLMQVQYYTWPWLNTVSEPNCGLAATSYDPNTLQGNANLGAKYLAYLSCFYSYDGGHAGTLQHPATYTIAWYYQQAGLAYPDLNNPKGSLCAAVYNDPNHPEYRDLPSTTSATWSCPYSATAGDTTLLDITLSAYNDGPGYTDTCGICNPWYVQGVEGYIPQFYSGALPT